MARRNEKEDGSWRKEEGMVDEKQDGEEKNDQWMEVKEASPQVPGGLW